MVSSERGQLILVGAIAIALILLGLVLIVNTALFTQIVGSEGTVESAKEGGVAGQEIGNSLSALVAEENRQAGPTTSYGNIDSAVDSDTGDLETVYRNQSLESGGSFISMEYRERVVEGSRIAQDDSGTFTEASVDAGDWTVISAVNRTDVGGFVMVIDTTQSTLNNDFEVQVDGAGPDDSTLTVSDNGSEVDVTVDGPVDESCLGVTPENDTVRIDLSNGRVYEDGDCQFEIFEPLESGYSIEFVNGDEVEGTYELATPNDSLLGNSDPRFSTNPGQPTRTEAVWSFEYAFTYDTPDATVETDRREVDVYD